MALIACPECGREVSNRAPACPECAFPLEEGSRASTRGARAKTDPANTAALEATKSIVGRLLLGGFFFASAIPFEAVPVMFGSFVIWGSCIPVWIKAKRAVRLGSGGGSRQLEEQLDNRLLEFEERQLQQAAEAEDRYARQVADLEERLDFTERLLAKRQERIGP